MIYLIVFIYLLYLSIHYDILENNSYKWTHYKIVVTLLILVAGLRWRIGSDTVGYASEFYLSHDLFHLEWGDFESPMRMPLWVLLNATCKSIWNDFLLVQFVVAAFGIGMIGHFIRKACPSLCFFVLLCYLAGGLYNHIHFELMRGSLSLGFFLLGILAVNDRKTKKFLLYFLVAVLFHVFTVLAVFLFVIGYYLIPRKPAIYWLLCVAMIVSVLVGIDFIAPMAEGAALFLPNEDMASQITMYSTSEWFGNGDLSITNYVWMVAQLGVYVFMFHKTQVIYPQYVRLKQDVFQTCVCISLLLACSRYSFMILYRMIDYFYFFTLFLSVMFAKGILIDRIVRRQKVLVFCVLLLFPLFFGAKSWLAIDDLGCYVYTRYYPYSSVFDKSLDPEREKHHLLRGEGWSRYNDY
jgi:hypothetical protein